MDIVINPLHVCPKAKHSWSCVGGSTQSNLVRRTGCLYLVTDVFQQFNFYILFHFDGTQWSSIIQHVAGYLKSIAYSTIPEGF